MVETILPIITLTPPPPYKDEKPAPHERVANSVVGYFLRLGASLFFAKLDGVAAGRGGRLCSCMT